MESSTNVLFLVISGTIGVVVTGVLLLYNVVAAVLFLRETGDGESSGLARAAWALGIGSLASWCLPCVGTGLAIGAVVVAQIERVRIYRDQSTIAGATPVRMGSVNGWASLVLQFLLLLSLVAGALVDPGDEPRPDTMQELLDEAPPPPVTPPVGEGED